MEDYTEFSLLPDLPPSDDGPLEPLSVDQLSPEEFDKLWKDFIIDANTLVNTEDHVGFQNGVFAAVDQSVSSTRPCLFARDTFQLRQSLCDTSKQFPKISLGTSIAETPQTQQTESNKRPHEEHYSVEIGSPFRTTTLQRLQASLAETNKINSELSKTLSNMVSLLDSLVHKVNNIEEHLKIKRKKVSFSQDCKKH